MEMESTEKDVKDAKDDIHRMSIKVTSLDFNRLKSVVTCRGSGLPHLCIPPPSMVWASLTTGSLKTGKIGTQMGLLVRGRSIRGEDVNQGRESEGTAAIMCFKV